MFYSECPPRHVERTAVLIPGEAYQFRVSAFWYIAVMARWRRSLVVRGMAVMLLLWTGADLTYSSLCALEQERDSFGSAAPLNPAVSSDVASTANLPVAPDPKHVDDCFCCSHCVDEPDLTPRLHSGLASRARDELAAGAPAIFGTPLYHPPLL